MYCDIVTSLTALVIVLLILTLLMMYTNILYKYKECYDNNTITNSRPFRLMNEIKNIWNKSPPKQTTTPVSVFEQKNNDESIQDAFSRCEKQYGVGNCKRV